MVRIRTDKTSHRSEHGDRYLKFGIHVASRDRDSPIPRQRLGSHFVLFTLCCNRWRLMGLAVQPVQDTLRTMGEPSLG